MSHSTCICRVYIYIHIYIQCVPQTGDPKVLHFLLLWLLWLFRLLRLLWLGLLLRPDQALKNGLTKWAWTRHPLFTKESCLPRTIFHFHVTFAARTFTPPYHAQSKQVSAAPCSTDTLDWWSTAFNRSQASALQTGSSATCPRSVPQV